MDFPQLGLYAPELDEPHHEECRMCYSGKILFGGVKKSDPDDDGDGSENTGDVEI